MRRIGCGMCGTFAGHGGNGREPLPIASELLSEEARRSKDEVRGVWEERDSSEELEGERGNAAFARIESDLTCSDTEAAEGRSVWRGGWRSGWGVGGACARVLS